MMSVDAIGDIRRAYFEQRLPIKEIVRTLRVSRATVRKVVRSHKTAFKYERGVQPAPKLGAWVDVFGSGAGGRAGFSPTAGTAPAQAGGTETRR